MATHRIRLKGPWEFQSISTTDDPRNGESASPQVTMPLSWRAQFGSTAGQVRYRRSFGKPTNLDDDESVAICFDGVGGRGTVRLNGLPLGEFDGARAAARFNITGRLEQRNLLEVELSFDPEQSPADPGGLWGVVALEISGPDAQSRGS